MSAINKELYDALIKANVPDDLATKAAQSWTDDSRAQAERVNIINENISVINARLAIVEKLQWIIVAGVIALIIKAFI